MLNVLIAAVLSTAPAAAAAPPPPIITVAAADPAKLAVATRIAARLLPDGSYRSVMDGMLGQMQAGIIQQMQALPVREFVHAAGLPEAQAATLGQGTMRDVLAIVDPNFAERQRLTQAAMNRVLVDLLSGFEPTMREGISIAYANRFTAGQLADIDAFFASPSGQVYAAANLHMMSDPAVMSRMQGLMRSMVGRMPAVAQQAQAATASLPPARKYADLTAAEKARLAGLLGVDPATLK